MEKGETSKKVASIYINERNECVKICREEKRNYEKDITDKCKENPKLFYRYVNDKLKNKQ